jgi:hypothetical protein
MIARRVHKLFWDFEKEERWLNEMAAQGLNLVRYRWGTYDFERGGPGEWIYRIQFLDDDARKPKSREYIDFVAETGAEPIDTYMRWVYFRKRAAEGPFEIFSDLDSRLAHYKRVLAFYGATTGILVAVSVPVFSRTIDAAERAIGPFWGMPIFVVFILLVLVFLVQTVRLARHMRELRARRTIEE